MIGICKEFLRNRSGAFAILFITVVFSIVAIPMVIFDHMVTDQKRKDLKLALQITIRVTRSYFQKYPHLSKEEQRKYAESVFNLNLNNLKPEDVKLDIKWPQKDGDKFEMSAQFTSKSPIRNLIVSLVPSGIGVSPLITVVEEKFQERQDKTFEIVFVVDHSENLEPINSALKHNMLSLLDKLHEKAKSMNLKKDPIRISYVPLGSMINVGNDTNRDWLDKDGLSPIHYENFDLSKSIILERNKKIVSVKTDSNATYHKLGAGWGENEGQKVTRFSLYTDMRMQLLNTGNMLAAGTDRYRWEGCVEARPYPHNVEDTVVNIQRPETFFVPSFFPDPPDNIRNNGVWRNYWHDDASTEKKTKKEQQKDIKKYFFLKKGFQFPFYNSPNTDFCFIENSLEELKNVTVYKTALKEKIERLRYYGKTRYIAEGLAWGWRILSPQEPFMGGRFYGIKGNYKFIVLITSGGNYIEEENNQDIAYNVSKYGSHGYLGQEYGDSGLPRLLLKRRKDSRNGMPMIKNASFLIEEATKELNGYQKEVCNSIKEKGIILITLALNFNSHDQKDKDILKGCASHSKHNKNSRLFYEADTNSFENTLDKILFAFDKESEN